MRGVPRRRHPPSVQSYAVYWNEGGGARFAGRLDLEPGYAQLAGRTAHGGRTLLRVPFLDIVDARYGNGRLRVDGSPGRRSRSAASTARPHFTSSRIGCKSAALPV